MLCGGSILTVGIIIMAVLNFKINLCLCAKPLPCVAIVMNHSVFATPDVPYTNHYTLYTIVLKWCLLDSIADVYPITYQLMYV